eukprot:365592-Chlamydomonas_euryale.AAC.18
MASRCGARQGARAASVPALLATSLQRLPLWSCHAAAMQDACLAHAWLGRQRQPCARTSSPSGQTTTAAFPGRKNSQPRRGPGARCRQLCCSGCGRGLGDRRSGAARHPHPGRQAAAAAAHVR